MAEDIPGTEVRLERYVGASQWDHFANIYLPDHVDEYPSHIEFKGGKYACAFKGDGPILAIYREVPARDLAGELLEGLIQSFAILAENKLGSDLIAKYQPLLDELATRYQDKGDGTLEATADEAKPVAASIEVEQKYAITDAEYPVQPIRVNSFEEAAKK